MSEFGGPFASASVFSPSSLYPTASILPSTSLVSRSRPSPFSKPPPLLSSSTQFSNPSPSSTWAPALYTGSSTTLYASSATSQYSSQFTTPFSASLPVSYSYVPSASSLSTASYSSQFRPYTSSTYSTSSASLVSPSTTSYLYSPSTPYSISTSSQYSLFSSLPYSAQSPYTHSSFTKPNGVADSFSSMSTASPLSTLYTDRNKTPLGTVGKVSPPIPKVGTFDVSQLRSSDLLAVTRPSPNAITAPVTKDLSTTGLLSTPPFSRPLPMYPVYPYTAVDLLLKSAVPSLPLPSTTSKTTDWKLTPTASFPPISTSITPVAAGGHSALQMEESLAECYHSIIPTSTATSTTPEIFSLLSTTVPVSIPSHTRSEPISSIVEAASSAQPAEPNSTAAFESKEDVLSRSSPPPAVVLWPATVRVSALLDEWPLHAHSIAHSRTASGVECGSPDERTSPATPLALGFEYGFTSTSAGSTGTGGGLAARTRTRTTSCLFDSDAPTSHMLEVERGLMTLEVDWGSPKDFQTADPILSGGKGGRISRSATASRPNSVFERGIGGENEELQLPRKRSHHKYVNPFAPVTIDVDELTQQTTHVHATRFEFPSASGAEGQSQEPDATPNSAPSPGESSGIKSRSRSCKSSKSSRGSRSSSVSGLDAAKTKLDLLVGFLHENSNDAFDCRVYLHNFLAASPELNFVAFHQDDILGLMGGMFVDEERTSAWIGTWHELGPEATADAAGRALLDKCTEAITLYSNAHVLVGSLFVGIGLPATSPAEQLLRHAGYELVEDEAGLGRSAWDGLTWRGHVNSVALERARKELLTVSAGAVATLHVARVPAPTAAIVELDARLTGLRRAHYLRSIAASACETLECWLGTTLVGYAFMLELRRAYWIVQVRTYWLKQTH